MRSEESVKTSKVELEEEEGSASEQDHRPAMENASADGLAAGANQSKTDERDRAKPEKKTNKSDTSNKKSGKKAHKSSHVHKADKTSEKKSKRGRERSRCCSSLS